jgi:choline kinase
LKAIILAAGRGSRMQALTADRPKCLVELAGRSLLSLQRAALGTAGIGEVTIVSGYRGAELALPGLVRIDNPRWAATNMVASLLCAGALLEAGPCLVSYADIFYGAETVRRLAAAVGDLAIAYDRDWLALWRRRFADPLADAETFRLDGRARVVEIGGRAASTGEIEGQYMGLLKIAPAGWRAVRASIDPLAPAARDRLDMTGLLARLIAAGTAVEAVPAAGPWGEVDSASDLALYEAMIRSGELVLPA